MGNYKMNRISEITKRDIYDLFVNGLEVLDYFETKKITYTYYGRLEEVEFLKKLYDLENLPSKDSRFTNAERDIWQHTINNNDYSFCWVFKDERFQLQKGSDETYLRFICAIFHPLVRDEKGAWKNFYNEVNRLLNNDGYELYPAEKVSNREVYGWRIYQPDDNKLFIPYSQRYAKEIKEKKIKLTIKRNARKQLYQLINNYDEVYQVRDETGWNYNVSTSEEVMNDVRQFYTPMYYNDKGQFVETNCLEDLICKSVPFYVLDVIEMFEKHNRNNDFESKANAILKLNNICLKLNNGRIESVFNSQIKNSALTPIQEVGLKELLQEATKYYDEGNLKIAVEKIWDAFERLKTYYSPSLDKKKSVTQIIHLMSYNKESYRELFEKEFSELTKIGNNFRIRHHETTKVDIEDVRHYDYFYKRCLSLISIAIQYLNK
jgi:hypothetical protein